MSVVISNSLGSMHFYIRATATYVCINSMEKAAETIQPTISPHKLLIALGVNTHAYICMEETRLEPAIGQCAPGSTTV